MFYERFPHDVYVLVKSNLLHALPAVPPRPAVTKVAQRRRQNPTSTLHLLGPRRGRLLGPDARLSVISAFQRRAVTQAIVWRPRSCPLAVVRVCRKWNQCRMSDRHDSQWNAYCVILTAAVTMSRSRSHQSVLYAAACIVINVSPWPCCVWISVSFYCNVV